MTIAAGLGRRAKEDRSPAIIGRAPGYLRKRESLRRDAATEKLHALSLICPRGAKGEGNLLTALGRTELSDGLPRLLVSWVCCRRVDPRDPETQARHSDSGCKSFQHNRTAFLVRSTCPAQAPYLPQREGKGIAPADAATEGFSTGENRQTLHPPNGRATYRDG